MDLCRHQFDRTWKSYGRCVKEKWANHVPQGSQCARGELGVWRRQPKWLTVSFTEHDKGVLYSQVVAQVQRRLELEWPALGYSFS